MSNLNLRKAQRVKDDEFYTMYRDIEKELAHYLPYFKGKKVYLNCDNPILSQFWAYFSTNFQKLELKELIATHYINQNPTIFDTKPIPKPNIYKQTSNGIKKGFLMDDGDFRSKECKDILAKSDIVVTNPPFSLFREFFNTVTGMGKQFLVLGTLNAPGYVDVFPKIQSYEVWLGHNIGEMGFRKVNGTVQYIGLISWFTNIGRYPSKPGANLTALYNPSEHKKYDNYNAVNIDALSAIPKNYFGKIGVPVTYMAKHNPNQFKLLTCSKLFKRHFHNDLLVNGKRVYTRIIIRRRPTPLGQSLY